MTVTPRTGIPKLKALRESIRGSTSLSSHDGSFQLSLQRDFIPLGDALEKIELLVA